MSLAPMVRLGTLPLRLLSLERGAHCVFTEEIPAEKLRACVPRFDSRLGTIDWVFRRGNRKPREISLGPEFSGSEASVSGTNLIEASMPEASAVKDTSGVTAPVMRPPPCVLRTCQVEAGR